MSQLLLDDLYLSTLRMDKWEDAGCREAVSYSQLLFKRANESQI